MDASSPVLDGAAIDASTAIDAQREAGPLPDASGTPDEDGNRDSASAVSVTVDGDVVVGTLESNTDRDFLRFEASEGQWLAVVLESDPLVTPEPLQVSFALYSSDESALSAARTEGCIEESELYVEQEEVIRVPATGTYYLELSSELGARGEEEEVAKPWRVRVLNLATSHNSLIVDESGDQHLTAQHRCLLVDFETASDVDTVWMDEAFQGIITVHDATESGLSGLEIVSGESLIARSKKQIVGDDSPNAALRVRGSETIGLNDHAIFVQDSLARFHNELHEVTNDTFATAEVVPLLRADSGEYSSFFHRLDAGDVDHFAFDTTATATLLLECMGEEFGSGVRDLELTALSSEGAVVERVVEVEDTFGSGLSSARLRVSVGPGRHVVRIAAGTPDTEVSGRLVVCAPSLVSAEEGEDR
jgi:hypothetical protein